MSVERLRQAAAKIRDIVQSASPGPWGHDDTGVYITDRLDAEALAQPSADAEVAQCYSTRQEADAALIALMASPPVALVVADCLDDIATSKAEGTGSIHPRAFALIDLILGGAE